MNCNFRKYLLDKAPFSEEQLRVIDSLCVNRFLRRKQWLLRESDVCRYYTFISKGCMKQCRVNQNGDLHVSKFAVEDCWIWDSESLHTGMPSKTGICAVEESELLCWTESSFEFIFKTIPEFDRIFRRVTASEISEQQNRLYKVTSTTAEERYLDFAATFPDMLKRVPLYLVAAYLGVTRETISRVRNNLTCRTPLPC